MLCGSDLFWYDYEKYGYTEADFDDANVVADAHYEEILEPEPKPIAALPDLSSEQSRINEQEKTLWQYITHLKKRYKK